MLGRHFEDVAKLDDQPFAVGDGLAVPQALGDLSLQIVDAPAEKPAG